MAKMQSISIKEYHQRINNKKHIRSAINLKKIIDILEFLMLSYLVLKASSVI